MSIESTLARIEAVELELTRFKKRLAALKSDLRGSTKSQQFWYGGRANAAVKRSSLDLSQVLRELRRPL